MHCDHHTIWYPHLQLRHALTAHRHPAKTYKMSHTARTQHNIYELKSPASSRHKSIYVVWLPEDAVDRS
jgi:hypothetical protein